MENWFNFDLKDAVRWRMLDRTVQAVKERNQDISADILEAMIDEAVQEVRAERCQQTVQH
jgi:hypothetical protein